MGKHVATLPSATSTAWQVKPAYWEECGGTLTVTFLPDFQSILVPVALSRTGSLESAIWYVFTCIAASPLTTTTGLLGQS